MSVKLTSYINLNGNAKAALDFYHDVFGGTVYVDTFGTFNEKSGGAMPVPAEEADKIMHAALMGEHVELMLSDALSSMEASPATSNVSLALNGDDAEVLTGYWERLVEGGTVVEPLEDAPWGGKFGMAVDKFGTHWMVNIDMREQGS